MAKLSGLNLKLLLKDKEVSADFREFDASTRADEVDTTTFGQTARQFIPGFTTGEWSLAGLYESGAGSSDEVLHDLMDDTAAAVATALPNDLVEGRRALLLNATASSYEVPASEGDAVAAAAAMSGQGGARWGQLIRVAAISTAESAASATGYDNPSDAATTKGAAFHLHVTANTRDQGTLTMKPQDSADNVTYADIAGLSNPSNTFTAVAAGATAVERITLPNGSTLRRYVKCFASSIGAGNGDYTVRVAYSRAY